MLPLLGFVIGSLGAFSWRLDGLEVIGVPLLIGLLGANVGVLLYLGAHRLDSLTSVTRAAAQTEQDRIGQISDLLREAEDSDSPELSGVRGVLGDPQAPVGLRAKALELLAESLGDDELNALIEEQTTTFPEASRVVSTAVRVLTQPGKSATAPALEALFPLAIRQDRVRIIEAVAASRSQLASEVLIGWASDDEAHIACTAIAALGRLGLASDAERLLPLLKDDREPVVIATLVALGQVGRAEHIPALRAAAEGLLRDGDVERAAQAAEEAIRQRLGHAPDGAISIHDAESDGALSVAARGGELSSRDEDDDAW